MFPELLASPSAERSFWRKARNLKQSFQNLLRNLPRIHPKISSAFLAGRKVFPKHFTDISIRDVKLQIKCQSTFSQHPSAGIVTPIKNIRCHERIHHLIASSQLSTCSAKLLTLIVCFFGEKCKPTTQETQGSLPSPTSRNASLTLLSWLFWWKGRKPPTKARIFLSLPNLKSLGKEGKAAQEGKENRKQKKQGILKKH